MKKNKLEDYILKKCGWTEEQLELQGMQTYKIYSRSDNKQLLAYVLTNKTSKDITVYLAIPDENGEKIKIVLDRESQKIDFTKTDPQIESKKSLDEFLIMIENTIKGTQSLFLPTISDYKNKHITSNDL